MVTRCVRRSLRDPEAFFTALMLPVVLMLMFVYVFGGAFNAGGTYANYVVPGLIVLCAGFGAGTTAVATDMTNGIVDRFRSMPISGSLVLVGHVVASLAGLLAGSVEAANSFTFVLMFLPYVSTAFVPAQTLPGWMRGFAEHQPFTPIVETMRGLWMGHTSTGVAVGHEAWIACAWCTAILVVSFGRGVLAVPPPDRRLTPAWQPGSGRTPAHASAGCAGTRMPSVSWRPGGGGR